VETNDALWTPIMVVLPLLSMNNSTKFFKLLPADIAEAEVGVYSACYKLGLFMVLYRTAYTLGIEPFFFSHSDDKMQTYAKCNKYFVIFGSFILLSVIVFC
jgi:hypothetical protein